MNQLVKQSALVWVGLSVSAGVFAQAPGLATRAGHELGVSVSSYKYTEPGYMTNKAMNVGLDYSGVFKVDESWFVRVEGRYAAGKADYSGSGTLNDRPQHYYEARALIGKDFAWNNDTVSPYIGLGYRHLLHDFRGKTSTNSDGYRRESTYLTLPLGLTYQTGLGGQARLVSTFEVAALLRGEQESRLSDIGAPRLDVTNRQRKGYGLRFGVAYQDRTWSIGPYVVAWDIKDSDKTQTGAYEPHNKTSEYGLRAAYRF
jgi:hypothetical protein